MTRRSLALFLAAPMFVLGACAGEDGGDENSGLDQTDGGVHYAVTLSDQGCEPAQISVEEGKIAFDVSNESSARVTEFHVLDSERREVGALKDVMRGQEKTLTLELAEGDYITRCPNGATEEGKLSVSTGGPDGGPGGGGTGGGTPEGGDGGTQDGGGDSPGGDGGGGTGGGGTGSGGDGGSNPQGGG